MGQGSLCPQLPESPCPAASHNLEHQPAHGDSKNACPLCWLPGRLYSLPQHSATCAARPGLQEGTPHGEDRAERMTVPCGGQADAGHGVSLAQSCSICG